VACGDTNRKIPPYIKNDKKIFLGLLEKLETLFNLWIDSYNGDSKELSLFCDEIILIVKKSSINVAVLRKDNKLLFYPEGDKILDKVLVEDVAKLLKDNSYVLYKDALKEFLKGNYNNSATLIYQCFEAWLKLNLDSSNTGIKNIAENKLRQLVSKKLRGFEVDDLENFVNNFINLILSFERYHNTSGKSKHPDSKVVPIKKAEIEFIIYQTGALIRLTEKLLTAPT